MESDGVPSSAAVFESDQAVLDPKTGKWVVPGDDGGDSDDMISDESDGDGPEPASMLQQMIAEADKTKQMKQAEQERADQKPFAEARKAAAATRGSTKGSKPAKKVKAKGFLRGGFFNKKSKKKSLIGVPDASPAESASKPSEPVEVVKPSGTAADSLRIPEVQAKLLESLGPQGKKLATGEWLTKDFMSKLQSDPVLAKGMTDPECQHALDLLKSNPAEAKKKYEGNKKVESFMKAFMSSVGEHFSKLGEKELKESKAGASGAAATPDPAAGSSGAAAGSGLVARSSRKIDKGEMVRRQGQGALAASMSGAAGASSSTGGAGGGPPPGATSADAADIAKLAREGKIAKDDPEVQKVLSDQQLLQILSNPQVMQLMEYLRQHPDQIRTALADPHKRRLLRLLERNGLIRLEGV